MLRYIRAADYKEQPWKNGGGVTHEIAAGDGWRLSIATIDRDGPFSRFDGYNRTIVAIDGTPVELRVGDEAVLLRHFEPLEFTGEEPAYARATGRARDLNAMTLRDEYVHDVEIVEGSQRFLLDEDEFAFVCAIDGETLVDGTPLRAGDALELTAVEGFTVEAAFHAAVVRVTAL